MKNRRIRLVLGLLLIFAAGGVYYWWYEHRYPSTDNAYVGGNVVRISPQVSGKITQIYVLNDQRVKTGQPLLRLDDKPYELGLAEARTAFDSAANSVGNDANNLEKAVEAVDDALNEHNTALAAYDFASARFNRLVSVPAGSEAAKEERDNALKDVKKARLKLDQATEKLDEERKKITDTGAATIRLRTAAAKLQRSLLDLVDTIVVAEKTGWTARLTARPGTLVRSGTPLFALVENTDRWIDANFKETEVGRLRVGQPVSINVDMYPDLDLKGRIESFSGGSGAIFSALPPENATGNWVKVTQRFTVRISVDNFPYDQDRPLRIGASASVTVDTTGDDEG